MLFAIDLQNDYLDPKGKFYFPEVETIKDAMTRRFEQAIENNELIAYTKNIYPKDEYLLRSEEEIKWAEEIHPDFKPYLEKAQEFKKIHYGISPEGALKFRDEFEDRKRDFEYIEFIGVETNVCVLANIAIVQNIFPNSGLRLRPQCTASSNPKLKESAIDLLKGLKVEVTQHER